jgi:hypothetical protein
MLALLLPVDFDSAKTRARFFADCHDYVGKIVLLKRIKWFDEEVTCKKCGGTGAVEGMKCKPCGGKGTKKSGPSVSHAWFLWNRQPISGRQIQRVWYAAREAQAVREDIAPVVVVPKVRLRARKEGTDQFHLFGAEAGLAP